MAILTKAKIIEEIAAGNIRICPLRDEYLNINSYDVTLSKTLKTYPKLRGLILDPTKEVKLHEETIPEKGYVLEPGRLYLAQVNEEIWSDKYVFELSGKSTLARLGITVHETAAFSNLGHEFRYVLEITVVHPVIVYPNMPIAQIFVHSTIGEVDDSYNETGHYAKNQKIGDSIAAPAPMKL